MHEDLAGAHIGCYVESCRGIAGGSGKSASAPISAADHETRERRAAPYSRASTLCGWRNHPDLLHKRQVVF